MNIEVVDCSSCGGTGFLRACRDSSNVECNFCKGYGKLLHDTDTGMFANIEDGFHFESVDGDSACSDSTNNPVNDRVKDDRLLRYIWKLEREYYEGEHIDQSLEMKLAIMYNLYLAAESLGEIDDHSMSHAYTDFVSKLLRLK